MRKLSDEEAKLILRSDAEFEAGHHRPAEEVFAEIRKKLRVATERKQIEKGAHVREVRRPLIYASRGRA